MRQGAAESSSQARADDFTWSVSEISGSIQAPAEVMEQIRAHAIHGLHMLSRGGVEVGGVLFGLRGEGSLRIEAWRPIEIEHAHGPAFLLSEQDRAGLATLLQSPSADPALAQLQPIGWFVSHTRGTVALNETDLHIFHDFFPWSWQVVLVLRPAKSGVVQAGFFFREPDGTVKAGESYGPFKLVPAVTSGVPRQPDPNRELPTTGQKAGPSAPGRIVGYLRNMPDRSVWWIWILVAALLATVIFTLLPDRQEVKHSAALPAPLSVSSETGQLRLSWNPNSPAVRNAQRAQVDIQDGPAHRTVVLNASQLHDGNVTYQNQTGDVAFLVTFYPQHGTPVTESERFLGPTPTAPASDRNQVQNDRDRLIQEVKTLRETLARETRRNHELEEAIRILRERREIEHR